MENTLHVVVYRYSPDSNWQTKVGGEFVERRLAENYVEILTTQSPTWEYAIVSGPIVPATRADSQLGKF
jgi:hypothetical protein